MPLDNLPAHSPLGASSAERWMKCPGSVSLIERIKGDEAFAGGEQPDYTTEGTNAHSIGAHCLEQEIDAWEVDEAVFPALLNDGMMDAVQEYLNHVRSLGDASTRLIEHRVHLPDFHPQFFGTLDCIVAAPNLLHVIDYKHGVGVVVDADDNPQLKYYAFGFLTSRGGEWPDEYPVRLTIVQPRAFHPEGAVRSWDTTAGAIKRWAEEELRPAMALTQDLDYLEMGSHCRFCPAKLVCPAFDGLAKKALKSTEITYAEAQQLKMMISAIEKKAYERLLAGSPVEGAKLVRKRADRTWKEEAEQALLKEFGQKAWQPLKLKSPAMVEKDLPKGKEVVAEWAFTPDAGYTVATADDKRKEVSPPSATGAFSADALASL